MVTLDLLLVALLAEALVLLAIAAIWYRVRYRRLDERIRAYLERRRKFLLLLEETREAVKSTRKQSIADWAASHEGHEETGRAIEDARIHFLDHCIETCRDCDGELYRFWNGSYGSLYSILAELSEKLDQVSALQDRRDDEPEEDAGVEEDDSGQHDGGVRLHSPDDGEAKRIAELERVVRYQAGKLSELNEFRWRYEELTTQFVNIRASNERLKQTLYDLLWKQQNEPQGEPEDVKALQEAMAEFERTNKEMALCLSTLEEENARLKRQTESIEDEQEAYMEAVIAHDGTGADALASQVELLESSLADERRTNEQLREELKDLQREYVALYAEQQAAEAKI